jgi:hypothetical protein
VLRRTGRACRAAVRGAGDRRFDEEGNLVAALILVFVLLVTAATAVATLQGGFGTADRTTSGAAATADANAGLRDALFRLDQLGDSITPFCVGQPPDQYLAAAGLTDDDCVPGGRRPIPSAPGLRGYVVSVLPELTFGGAGTGVTDDLSVTSYAVDLGQTRTVHADVYRVADDFGFFGVSGFNSTGTLSNSPIFLAGNGGSLVQIPGAVPIGVGANGNAFCNGKGSQNITVIGGLGSNTGVCPGPGTTGSTIEAEQPGACTPSATNGSFAPCIDLADGFATDSFGKQDCPLPGAGSLGLDTNPPLVASPFNVYNCATLGAGPLTISDTNGPVIPPGSYFVDADQVTVGPIVPSALSAGPVNLFILPNACGEASATSAGGANCPVYYPPSSAGNLVEPPGTGGCTLPPSYTNTNISLTIGGDVNSSPTIGDPANFNLYWSGDNVLGVPQGRKYLFVGYLYAPGAVVQNPGNNGLAFEGRFVLNCFSQNGSPNFTFLYPLHPRDFLSSWSVGNYVISP